MTTLPQQTTWDQYTANGMTTEFTYSFYIPEDKDIQVFVTPPNTIPIPQDDIQTLNFNYTVQNAGNQLFQGGTITFISGAPVAGSIVTLARNVADEIDTQFSQARNISGINLDNAFNILMMCIQQNTTNFNLYGLQYVVNDLVPNPSQTIMGQFNYSNQIPRLPNGYIWMGQGGGVIAVLPELDPDAATLAAQLLMETVGTNGCSIIGYNDPNNGNAPQLLRDFLDNLPAYINNKVLPAFGTAAGSANAITVTIPSPFALVAGQSLDFLATANNTGATTIQVTSNFYDPPVTFAIKNIFINFPTGIQACKGGEITSGSIYSLVYDGNEFQIKNPSVSQQLFAYINKSDTQNLNNGNTPTLITWNLPPEDPYNMYSGSPNYYFTAPVKGLYWINAEMHFVRQGTDTPTGSFAISVYVNGSQAKRLAEANVNSMADNVTLSGSIELILNAGEHVALYAQNGTDKALDMGVDGVTTNFQITYRGTAI